MRGARRRVSQRCCRQRGRLGCPGLSARASAAFETAAAERLGSNLFADDRATALVLQRGSARARRRPVKPVLLLELQLLNANRAKNATMNTNEGSYGSLESWISQSEGRARLLNRLPLRQGLFREEDAASYNKLSFR